MCDVSLLNSKRLILIETAVTVVLTCHTSLFSDTSNVSIGDLENIQETDTPPQSPTDSQRSTNDTVTINMDTPGHTVHYRKRGDQNHADETDIESMSPKSKVPSDVPSDITPRPRLSSFSPATSPVSYPNSPKNRKARVGSPTEEIARLAQDQPRRLAQHNTPSQNSTPVKQPLSPQESVPPAPIDSPKSTGRPPNNFLKQVRTSF